MEKDKEKEKELSSIVVDKQSTPDKAAEPQGSFKRLFSFATAFDVFLIIIGTICAIGAGMVMPLFVLVLGNSTDSLNASTPDEVYRQISQQALYMTLIGIGAFVTHTGTRFFWTLSSERQIEAMRIAYLKNIMRQDVSYFDTIGTGALTTKIVTSTLAMQDAIGDKFGLLIAYSSTFVAGIVIGFTQQWKLTLVVLSMLPLMMASGGFVGAVVTKAASAAEKAYSSAGSVANEMISGIRTVQSFNLQPVAVQRYLVNLDQAFRIGVKKSGLNGLSMGIVYFVFFGSYSLTFWYGGKLYESGEVTGGQVLTVIMAVLIASFVIGIAFTNVEYVMKGIGASAGFFEVLDRKPIIINDSDDIGKKLGKFEGRITLRDVHFRYPSRPEAKVLHGLNLEIPPGRKIALVGPSGSGKSSIIQLLQRFYDPEEGSVSLDGVDLKDLNVRWLRNQFGIVGQEPALLTGTIKENIAFGYEGASQDQIEQATRAALAHDFIMGFPLGYDTQVGERGAQLSGGQKQRIAIARAILKNPQILLLDEATSALDSESEKKVQIALDNASEGRTTIIVAHRLSTIRNADLIAVISKGTIAELGTHDELIAMDGVYANLVRIQVGSSDNSNEEQEGQKSEIDSSKEIANLPEDDDVAQASGSNSNDDEGLFSKTSASLRRLFALNRPEVPQLLVGVFGSIMIGLINTVQSIFFGNILTAFYLPTGAIDHMRPWLIGYIGLAVGMLLGYLIQGYFFGYVGQKLVHRCRELSYRSILRQEVGWFDFKANATGVLTGKLASEATQVEGAVGTPLGAITSSFAALVTGLVIAYIYGWRLAWVMTLIMPFLVVGQLVDMILMSSSDTKKRDALVQANQVATESISNVRTVAAYVNEAKMVEKFKIELIRPRKMMVRNGLISALLSGFGQFSTLGANALGFWYGGKLIRDGDMNFADFIIIFQAIVFAAETLSMSLGTATNLTKARSAAAAIFQLMDRVSRIDPESPEGVKKDAIAGEIIFENVNFVYPTRPNAKILRSLNLTIKRNQITALVGASGCGKSSSIGLIQRWYDPLSGSIKLDGTDLKDYNLKWLREQIGIVGQEPVLFSGTIAENIGISSTTEKPNQKDIEEAARHANAHDFITNFPDGYLTQVGEKGAQLSGGQKQRIAIARAIFKKPQILLLDEATSALDTESEQVVQQALDNVMAGRTTIVIAHRLSTVRRADHIVVIQKGVVVEQGTHNELMGLHNHYYKLVEAQTNH